MTLQLKITIIFISMTLLILLILGSIFYTNTTETLKESKEKEMKTIAIETANKIERFLFERSGDIDVLSESKILTMPEVQNSTRLHFLSNVMEAYKTYDSIFVLDLNGKVTLSTGDVPNIERIRNGLINSDSYISEIITNEEGEKLICFSKFLINESGVKIGTVVEVMNFHSIEEIVENVTVGKSGYAKLEVVKSNVEINSDNHAVKIKSQGEDYITISVPIKEFYSNKSQWSIKVLQREDEAYEVINNFIKYLLLISFVIFVLFSFLSIIISKVITEPIRNLMYKVNQLMKGNKRYNFKYKTKNEIKSLTSSFDILLEQLNFMMQMVLEKTGEAAYMGEFNENIKDLFKSISKGILTIDAKGQVTSINRAAAHILKLDYNNEYDLNINNNETPGLGDFFKILKNSFVNDIKYRGEICNISHGKEGFIPVIFNTLRQTDHNGELIGMTVIINNLEEKRMFQESIFREKHLSQLGELSAGMAHEIRNPLASIKGYAQIARMELEESHQSYEDLTIILNEVERLDRIIERFMAFARPNQPIKTEVSIGDLIDETIRLMKSDLVKNRIKVKFVRANNDKILVDYEQIKQVLINILINAIQASSHGDEILIKTYGIYKENFFAIKIIDQGVGINDEIIDKIFTPFYTTKEDGSGLGLSISSQIIKNHQGFLEIDNTLKRGTSILIKLPMRGEDKNE
ncbi:ATP-binding protein [Sporosalibacterium faouarense]|uniref:ATP-binding protein n=1 Tax=Sporosalibacterium faouarense TaxID=516123 RepID=UPI00192C1BDF|nr:ATP-binding protein [Sporosalibacterium faouarense]